MTNYLKYIIFVWAFVLHLPVMAGAGDLSQSFTLEGHLFDSPTSTDPFLAEATITLRILSPDKLCVLYAEEQIVNTSATDGTFNINVGSFPGAAKRVAGDSGNSMAQVFQNTTVITATGGTCPGVTSYTPGGAGGYGRYLEISVTPTSTGITDVLSPAIYMGSIPSALVSQTLQGFVPANFLRLATVPNLTQANLEDVFSNTNYPILQNLLAGGATSSTTDSIIDADSDGNSTGSIKFTIDSSLKSEIKNDGDFVVGTNSLYVDAATSRVAIGTANPSFDLSFMGTSAKAIGLERNATPASAGSDMTIKSGGATALGTDLVGGSLYLASGISTGDKTSAIYLQTATAGAPGSGDNLPTTKMTILGNGNVGIGTAAPGEKLSVVAGNVVVSNAYAFGWGNRATQIIGEDNSAGGNGLRFDTNGVERMRLNADGKVGIGTTTPALKLNVTGDNSYPASSGTAQTGMLRIAGTSNNVLDMGSAGVTPFGNWLQSTDKTALGTNYPLLLNPNGGNVGIGLANPIIKLEVVGDAGGSLIKAGAGGTRNITLAVGSNRVGMHMRNDGVSHAGITSDGSDIFFGTASSTINPDNWGTELMTIKSDGKVGIGTAAPGYKLDVQGGGVNTSGVYTNVSDIRLKKEVQPLESSLDKILRLKGVSYYWKDQSIDATKQVGFIAQEVEKIFPEVVKTDGKGFKAMSYSQLVSPIVEALKELYSKVMALYERDSIHEKQIAAIKVQMKAMNRGPASAESVNEKIKSLEAENAMMKSYFCSKDPSAPFCKK